MVPGVTRDRNMRSRYRCSMCPAIHINSRSWLRSSSTHEPSDPPLRVSFVYDFVPGNVPAGSHRKFLKNRTFGKKKDEPPGRRPRPPLFKPGTRVLRRYPDDPTRVPLGRGGLSLVYQPLSFCHDNDPSAGSPTETLLRLLLPLNDQV